MIPTNSYVEIYERYAAAVSWMEGLGIKVSPGRTAHYERVLGHWKDAYRTATQEEVSGAFQDFVSSNLEVRDFIEIYESFKDESSSKLGSIKEKLEKGVNGPIHSAEETPKSTVARNFLFEALVAARAHRPGYGIEAILDAESDTGIYIDGKKLWIECKRVTSVAAIEPNVAKASRQAKKIIKNKIGSGHRGIVALDVTKILNPEGGIFRQANDHDLKLAVDNIMNSFIRTNSPIWRGVYKRRTRKIIATFIRFSFMAVSEERKLLVHATQWGVDLSTGAKELDNKILKNLVSVLGEPK